jgi:hypothetical protein
MDRVGKHLKPYRTISAKYKDAHRVNFLTRKIDWNNVDKELFHKINSITNRRIYDFLLILDNEKKTIYKREELMEILECKDTCFKQLLELAKTLGILEKQNHLYRLTNFDIPENKIQKNNKGEEIKWV